LGTGTHTRRSYLSTLVRLTKLDDQYLLVTKINFHILVFELGELLDEQ
jgi:hypothetical protein